MKDKIFGVLQRVGRSFMLPIAILPVAGLLLGIGSSFTNATTIETYGLTKILGDGTLLHSLLVIMNSVGSAVFNNLPLIFAVGVAIGMAKKEKEVAALSAVIAFFVMNTAINAMLTVTGQILANGEIAESVLEGTITSVCGIQSLQMGVFGGIIVGLGVAALHNKFYRIQLPNALSFFGGTRFVPIISTIVYMFVGILLYFVWPVVQNGIYALGGLVTGTGYVGTLIFGLIKRALIPFGLHHVFYMPFWQTAVGGTMEVAGQMVQGGQNIFFAQLADSANVAHFSADATRYFSGEFIFMIFGLPGAAMAMYQAALPEKKKEVSGLLLSAALTSMLTGITEPLEFTFLFTAPLLYGIHCVFAGLAYMLMHMLNVGVGMTFSGGLIDLFLFGILQGNKKTGWLWIVVVGVFYFLMYCAVFLVLIRKLDYKTPGREVGAAAKLYTRSDVEQRKEERKGTGPGQAGREKSAGKTGTRSGEIVKGLGGPDNITDVDCCATRLRCTVKDEKKVDESVLKATGASGVIKKGKGVQIIYGPQVSVIKSDLEEYLEKYGDESDEGDSHELIKSPMTGTVIPLSEVPDEAFAGKMMGDGAAVIPDDEYVYAPADGTVTFVFPTKHAIGFQTDGGHEMLIHVGIDTVSLSGDSFEAFVHDGDHVRTGDKLLKADIQEIKDKVPSLASPVLFTDLPDCLEVHILKRGKIRSGEPFLELHNKEK